MDPASAEQASREVSDALLPWRIRVSALTALVAMGAFALIDRLSLDTAAAAFRIQVRAGFTPAYLVVIWLAGRGWMRRFVHELVIALAAIIALELSIVGVPLPASESVGFFPAMLYFGIFLPLPLVKAAFVSLLFVATFVAVHLGFGVTPTAQVIKHAGNLLAAAGVSVVAAYMAERMRKTERAALAAVAAAEEQRRLSAAVLSGEEAERRRLARDLHDITGQGLIAALLRLDLALKRPGEDPRGPVAEARSLVNAALEDVRAVCRDLHPPTLAELGLVETLRTLAATLSTDEQTVRVEAGAEVPARLPPATAIAAFRVAQAALANSIRHGKARSVVVRLSARDGALLLEVEDDGAGFATARTRQGVGLMSMRERAASLGGTFAVESEPGKGTRVRAVFPLQAPQPRAA